MPAASSAPGGIVARPPWQLKGRGYIFLYRFSSDFLDDPRVVPPSLRSSWCGGPGVVMWVDYESSNVGPYSELLFIPGQFDTADGKYYSITTIYVSSEVSVVHGRANWGIPKQRADFDTQTLASTQRQLQMSFGGRSVVQWQVRGKGPKLPVTTAIVPSGMRTLAQTWDEKTFLTAPKARGWMRSAKVESVHIDADVFPDVSQQALLGAFEVSSFRMEFPKPRVLGQRLLPIRDESKGVRTESGADPQTP